MKPVMYLDIDDVLLDWSRGGLNPRAALGAREFLLWAIDNYEVRWLTYWAPNGRLDPDDVGVLARTLQVPPSVLHEIRGLDWSGGSTPVWGVHTKLDGIAWVEHLAMGRPFVWVEDETVIVPQGLDRTLRAMGFAECWLFVNSSRRRDSLQVLHERLMGRDASPEGVRLLSEAELIELVERALAGEGALDRLYSQAVFGGEPPRMWRQWPTGARDGWDAAVRLYFARKAETAPPERINDLLEAPRAWDAVEESMQLSIEEGRLSWADLARRLGMGERQALHMLSARLGFRIVSPDKKGVRRRLEAGPCVVCLKVEEVGRLERRKCPNCRLLEQSQPAAETEADPEGVHLGAGEDTEPGRE